MFFFIFDFDLNVDLENNKFFIHYFVNDIDEAGENTTTRDLTIFLRRRRSIIFSLSEETKLKE